MHLNTLHQGCNAIHVPHYRVDIRVRFRPLYKSQPPVNANTLNYRRICFAKLISYRVNSNQ